MVLRPRISARSLIAVGWFWLFGALVNVAVAAESNPIPAGAGAPERREPEQYLARFWLVDPRVRPSAPKQDSLKIELHGEYQARYTRVPEIALSNYGLADYRDRLGQSQRLEHWLRFNPRIAYRQSVAIVAQFDVPYGLMLGEGTDHVATDPEPMTESQPMRFALRWLYADIRIPKGHVTLGQQPASWGSGLLLASGDDRQFLGDARFGTIVERAALQTRPFDFAPQLELTLATDWVHSDRNLRWLDGDRALRGLLGVSYVTSPTKRLGILLVGEKAQPKQSDPELARLRPNETTATIDFAGETTFAVPGQPAYVVASGEGAVVMGRTSLAPELDGRSSARVQRMGALGRIGAIATSGTGDRRWGRWGIMVEWGYASGDADPTDGVDRAFVANPSRRVGLILFDEFMRWKSARAAQAFQDERLGMRPHAMGGSLPTAGAPSGATYWSLQALVRPRPNFDLRASALLAQTAADLVDPAMVLSRGRWTNYDGGTPRHRDLGIELDAASEYRQPLENGLSVSLGVEGGVLFPGQAFSLANESSMTMAGLVRGRFGFYF